ncbi:conserved hypothetical protein [Gloeothece citriformis PCC 7424]|uniref:DGQHR domain protein n=1 Tax=Gloeothece citriformis (strain PCC 7424) TaxID=65393 RepID=B7KCZ9_GLOC7|nr:hypothetical protein [Gloeothece citriformis]ACK73120.1 conserved hypothetical protein [Gloeothece citriformis PCC 7424]
MKLSTIYITVEKNTMTQSIEKVNNQKLDIIKDERVNCYSVMVQLEIDNYLNLIKKAFNDRGSLEGQRDTLKTTTAIRIRNRMIEDLKAGAVLPPIVLGVIVSDEQLLQLQELDDTSSFRTWIKDVPTDNISIIDGMQRTTALREALEKEEKIKNHKIRIEYWIASKSNSLTYRMLVLNTGQIPWNLRRQIETVFRPIIKELKEKYPDLDIMEINDEKRRSRSGQFQAGNIIELFLVFGARKEKIDILEKLADEFTRLDFIESTANPNFTDIFYEVINYLAKFDKIISIYQPQNAEGYFKRGMDLFSSHPACIGFVTAIALSVLGRPGLDYSVEKQNENWNKIKQNTDHFLERLTNMNSKELGTFLDFNTLNEIISKKPSKASYYEREFFLQAFKVLIEEKFELKTMTPCWRAY